MSKKKKKKSNVTLPVKIMGIIMLLLVIASPIISIIAYVID